jgi:hypothetical protein
MDNLNENQGRGTEQTKANEKLAYWSWLGLILLILIGCIYYLGHSILSLF